MNKRILIVDDDEMVLIAVNELLKQEGYEVYPASNGSEALEKLDQGTYDLIMLDIIMPEMSGFELCKKIREMENYKETPIIVITTEGASEDRERALALGANEYITKPIQTMKILETVKKLMNV